MQQLLPQAESATTATVEDVPPPSQKTCTVEFAGWLPVFGTFGNCGYHPQFDNTRQAPAGYRFVRSLPEDLRKPDLTLPQLARPVLAPTASLAERLLRASILLLRPPATFVALCFQRGPVRCFGVLWALLRLLGVFLLSGGRLVPTLRFLRSREFASQVLLPRSELVFLTSVPYTYGQQPWVIEIEDLVTLFLPFITNGATHAGDVRTSPYFPLVRALLEGKKCRGIITHMRATAESLPRVFESPALAEKVSYVPLGIELPPERPEPHNDDTLELLFTCSWHQDPQSFYLRGGLDVLDAFAVIKERYPQVRLTLRTALPRLPARYFEIIEKNWVRVISRYLSAQEMDALQRQSDVFLLPAARIHVLSLLKPMSFGRVVVASDGWGMDEYIAHGRTGLVVKGRHGKVSWSDPATGMLKEDYRAMFRSDPEVVAGLVEAISQLVEDPGWRRNLGRNARREVETRFSLEQWNRGLKTALDRAIARG